MLLKKKNTVTLKNKFLKLKLNDTNNKNTDVNNLTNRYIQNVLN